MGQSRCIIEVEGQTIEEVSSFDLSDDVMAITEDAHVVVENRNHKYRDLLRIGQKVEIYLANPQVNFGAPTLKHKGRITERKAKASRTEGSTIAITSSDLGWHLQKCAAPLWLRLKNLTYQDLVDPSKSKFYDPSWGFVGVRFDGDIRRKLKLGVAIVAQAAQKVLDPVHVIQCEAGDNAADKFLEYCRRLNLLVNVSADGYLCCFRPNDRQEPLYRIRLLDDGPDNNVLSAELTESAESRYTETICVGEQIGWEGPQDSNNPNARKKRGSVRHAGALPFVHRKTFVDGEMFANGLAQKAAEWAHKRGMYDSFSAVYDVPEHCQGTRWWVGDTTVDVQDDELGVYGCLYVQAVRLRGGKSEGDTTQVIVRLPGLLSASFGEIPNPPICRALSVEGTAKEGT